MQSIPTTSSQFGAPQDYMIESRRLFSSLPVAAYICDASGQITYFNERAAELWGREPKLNDPTERFCGAGEHLFDDGSPLPREQYWMAFSLQYARRYSDCRVVIARPDGARRYASATYTPILDEAQRVSGACGILVDITEQVRATDFLNRQTLVFEKIVMQAPLDEMLAEIIALMEGQLPGVICSILLLEPDGLHLRVAAAPSLPPAYNAAIDGVAIGPSVGSCGTAAYRREPVFVDDIANDPLWVNYKELAASHGLCACWSTPVLSIPRHGQTPSLLGTFACYARQPGMPDPMLVTLLSRADGLVRIALESERANKQLRQSEARLRCFLDHATDAFFLLRHGDGAILDVNEEACRSLGYSRDELLGARPTLFGNRGPDELLAKDLKLVQQQGALVFDTWHCRKDGVKFPVEVRIRRFLFEGQPLALAFARDMTDRVRAENTLRESEAFLRLAQKHSPVGSLQWNLATNRVKWSEGMAQIHGIPLDEFDGSLAMAHSFIHPDDRAFLQQQTSALLSGAELAQWEYRIRRPDGAVRYVWPASEVLCDVNGVPTEVVGVCIDITERIQSQEALRESEKRFRQLAEAVFQGLIIHERGVLRLCNEAFVKMVGATSAESLIGTSFLDSLVLTPESKRRIQQRIQSPQEKILEIEILLPDQTVRIVETHGQEIMFEGRAARVVALLDVTNRRNDEKSLRLFRELVDRLEDAIEVIDAPTGRFLDVNDRGCQDLGYSREEFLSLSVFDIDPIFQPDFYYRFLDLVRETGNQQFETIHRRRDGSCFPVEINCRHLRLDQEYLLAVVRDISERKRQQEALRVSEELFRSAFDFSSIGMGLAALDGRFLRVNQSLCDIVGYTSEELLALDFQTITHPDDIEPDLNLLHKLISGEIPSFRLEKRYIHKLGNVVWILLIVSLIKDREGNPLYALGQMIDISQSKDGERQLAETTRSREEALALLDTLHAQAPIGLAFVNLEFRFIRCNDAMAEIDGAPAASILGQTVQETVPQLWPQIEPLYRRVLSGDGPIVNWQISGETAARPGVTRHWSANYYPVRIGAELIGVGVAVHEVTEQRRLEEQVRHAHKMEAVGRLAGGVAHDFNNLLTVINGHSRLLLEHLGPNDPLQGSLNAIHEAGKRAAALVRQLLAFSRGQESQPADLDLNEVIAESAGFFRQLLGDACQLSVEIEPNLAAVRADRSQMEQVLMNLVVNARDAMPQGGRLTMKTRNLDLTRHQIGVGCDLPPGSYVQVSVADTGQGMRAEVQARIFEPFFTTKEVDEGTGLGLSVVHGIVQQSGGQIVVESEVGVGSCFSIRLPARTT
jgi:PAS domain S-box-containing protein